MPQKHTMRIYTYKYYTYKYTCNIGMCIFLIARYNNGWMMYIPTYRVGGGLPATE